MRPYIKRLLTKFYTIGQLLDGIEYCIDTERCSAYELLGQFTDSCYISHRFPTLFLYSSPNG